jgi:mRNA interferase RelE/StbE
VAYEIVLKPSAQRDLDDIPDKEVARIAGRIRQLSLDPRPFGAQKLSGQNAYRIRIGSYRVLYEIDDKAQSVDVFRVRHRKEAYR